MARGAAPLDARAKLEFLPAEVIPFDKELALQAAALYSKTSEAGLSLGDRACLATAIKLRVPAVTTDRSWSGLPVSVKIHLVR